jgi:hypothetical protein
MNYMKINLKDTGCEEVAWIHIVQDVVFWQQKWTFGFHERWKISWLAEWRAACLQLISEFIAYCHETCQSGKPVHGPRFQTGSSRIQRRFAIKRNALDMCSTWVWLCTVCRSRWRIQKEEVVDYSKFVICFVNIQETWAGNKSIQDSNTELFSPLTYFDEFDS